MCHEFYMFFFICFLQVANYKDVEEIIYVRPIYQTVDF
jgi:hypothetical protein